jgi:hypothetical protein
MEQRDVKAHIRTYLRERPNSKFAEVFYGVTKHGATSTEVHNAMYEMLKNDELQCAGNCRWNICERKAS